MNKFALLRDFILRRKHTVDVEQFQKTCTIPSTSAALGMRRMNFQTGSFCREDLGDVPILLGHRGDTRRLRHPLLETDGSREYCKDVEKSGAARAWDTPPPVLYFSFLFIYSMLGRIGL
jgi:hypothetical protein